MAVEASYYAGGPLPNAEVNWQVTSSPGSYSPPNWPDFIFGSWSPWWFGGFYAAEAGLNLRAGLVTQTFQGFSQPAGTSPDLESSTAPCDDRQGKSDATQPARVRAR